VQNNRFFIFFIFQAFSIPLKTARAKDFGCFFSITHTGKGFQRKQEVKYLLKTTPGIAETPYCLWITALHYKKIKLKKILLQLKSFYICCSYKIQKKLS